MWVAHRRPPPQFSMLQWGQTPVAAPLMNFGSSAPGSLMRGMPNLSPQTRPWPLPSGPAALLTLGQASYVGYLSLHQLSRFQILSQHLRLLGAQGKKSVTLRGVVTTVRLCEKVAVISPTVSPIQWAMFVGADK